MKSYELIVIGGGPGGYVAALRAAKAGSTVALVEADQVGGTCLNRGCIPSKTLLRHSEVIEQLKKAKEWGIETGEITFAFDKLMQRKNKVIEGLRAGIESLLKANKIERFDGFATVHPDKTVTIKTKNDEQIIRGEKVIIATGSSPALPPIAGLEQDAVHTSDTIFDITEAPKSIAIIGGGVIGVEIACIFVHLNTEVTIIEMDERLVPAEDPEASAALQKALQEKGVNIATKHRVQSMDVSGNNKHIQLINSAGESETRSFSEILIATGRKPNLKGLELLDLKLNGPYIKVNDRMETSIPGIYAVGDVIGGWQLAHVASAEGIVAAWNATNESQKMMDYRAVPRCIYTFPEVASVGLTEAEAAATGASIRTAVYPLRVNGKALAMDETAGFMKIISESKHGQILGVIMVGAHATEMISEAASFIFMEGTTEELAHLIHPHPSLSEGLFESAASLAGIGVHM